MSVATLDPNPLPLPAGASIAPCAFRRILALYAMLQAALMAAMLVLPDHNALLVATGLAFHLPLPVLAARRLRDAGLGAGWLVLALLPPVGTVVLAGLLCRPTRAFSTGQAFDSRASAAACAA